jgi:cyclophilin family peptidyl-prolyl cis-trans isomerase
MKNFYKFIIPLFALAFLLVSCSKTMTPAETAANAATKLAEAKKNFDGKPMTGKHTVVLKTSDGDITIELDADAAPRTVTNFINLAKAGYYDNLNFHRVIPNFMIQGGDPSGDGTGGESLYGPTFEDEINAKSYGLDKKKLKDEAKGEQLPPEYANLTIKEFYEKQGYSYNDALTSLPLVKGAIAMANRGPGTNGSQFFILHAESTPWLDGRHTVFGKVTGGMDIVDKIANSPRDAGDKPNTPITFTVEVKN